MTDSDGHLVGLASLVSKGAAGDQLQPRAVVRLLRAELHALARAYPEIVALGGEVVSIVPETAKYARTLQQARGLPFRVLTALDLAYALSLGLVFWVGEKSSKLTANSASILNDFKVMAAGCCPSPRRW
jgi:hypothetical protein